MLQRGIVRNVRVVVAAMMLLAAGGVGGAPPADAAAAKCMGKDVTIPGTPGDDVLRGTPGNDVFLAGAGDDKIYGFGGNDRVCAGPGDDVVRGGKGRDRIKGGAGNDQILGGKGRDRILGGGGSDILEGNAGNDVIIGGPGTDSCLGAADSSGCEPAFENTAGAMVAQINVVRAEAGQPPLTLSVELSKVATAWSQQMASSGEFFHNPNYDQQYPAGFRAWAENIAYNVSAEAAQRRLEGSALHRANMVSPHMTEVGIGIFEKDGRIYVTQNFGGR